MMPQVSASFGVVPGRSGALQPSRTSGIPGRPGITSLGASSSWSSPCSASLTISGCGFDVYKLPLPGGTDVGDDPITVHIMFRDVLDLVPQSTVKVNDVNVGKVTDVRLDGFTADVTVQLRKDTELPDNAVATIRQTSLLGEKFVSLAAARVRCQQRTAAAAVT